jgi:hypothetical protein
MNSFLKYAVPLIALCASISAHAGEKIELDTTYFKGNKELPKILYVVPWQDIKQNKREEQTLVIHSLYGDLFDPLVPQELPDQKPD